MSEFATSLLKLYVPLVAWVCFGVFLGHKLPQQIPFYLGKFLFWIGVPLSIITFLRQTDLSASIWVAPVAAWAAIAAGAGLAWLWIQLQLYLSKRSPQSAPHLRSTHPTSVDLNPLDPSATQRLHSKPSQGSFLLASMIGNTGYLGYPVTLALVGPQYFGWAIFYDTIGSTLGAYGLGVLLAARFGLRTRNPWTLFQATLKNPALWSFWIGLGLRNVPLLEGIEQGLKGAAWTVIALSLLLIGMRLSQITSWRNLQQAMVSLSIKMLIVPLLVGLGLSIAGINGPPQLIIVLQVAMPPAFATLVIAEAFDLDRDLTVTALAAGSVGLLVTLPLWLWLFAP